METEAHLRLKRLAVRFLLRAGCQAAAMEVRAPRSRYRIDAAGYLDARPKHSGNSTAEPLASGTLWSTDPDERREQGYVRCEPRTALIECKQSRGDLLRDVKESGRLLDQRDALELRRREIEERLIKVREPHLRESGAFLFEELERWDFSASESDAYRRIVRRLRIIERKLHGETKFWLASRYRLADRLYVLAPAGLARPRELPRGWGLIECAPGLLRRRRLDDEEIVSELRIMVRAPERNCGMEQRTRLLRNIAVSATRQASAAMPSAGG